MSNPIQSFRDDFRRVIAENGQRVALICEATETQYTYTQVAEILERITTLLHRHGVAADNAVASLLPNSPEALLVCFAALRDGLDFHPISHEASAAEIGTVLDLRQPKLCFVGATTHDLQLKVLQDKGTTVVSLELDGTFSWLPAQATNKPFGDSGGRLHLSTSGSTGEPRGIVLDSDRLWSSGKAFLQQHPFVNADSRFLNILSMSYLGGIFNLGMIPLGAGGSVVLAEPFSGKSFFNFWQTVDRYDVDVLWLVPTIVRGLLALANRTHRHQAVPAPRVKVGFLGTAPLDLATKEKFEQTFNFPLLENFALSETTFFTSETMSTRLCRSEGSVGQRLPYAEIKLVPLAPEDAPDSKSGGEFFEIHVRSPYLFLGYQKPDGSLELKLDDEGFFATGDIGHFDQTNNLVIDGRQRDIIKKGGVFVALREIEVIAETHPAVAEAAAAVVAHDFFGEAYVLFVRLEHEPSDPDFKNELGKWLRERINRTKWPESIKIVEQFPCTPSGKVRKGLLFSVPQSQA